MPSAKTPSWTRFVIELILIIGVIEFAIVFMLHSRNVPPFIEMIAGPVILSLVAGPIIIWKLRQFREFSRTHNTLESQFRALRIALEDNSLISVTDENGIITDVNNGFCQISGYTKEELVGRTHKVINSGFHPKEFWNEMWDTVKSGEVWRGEVCNRSKDGAIYWVASTIIPQLNAKQEVTGFISIRFDMTDVKQAIETLRQTQDLLDQTSMIASVGGWEFDVQSQKLHWTDEVYRIHELEVGDQPSVEDAIKFYAPEARDVISAALQAGIRDGIGWDHELPFITAKGKRRWVRARGKSHFIDGQCVKLSGIFQDITEGYLARQQLDQTKARLSTAIRAANIGLWDWDITNGHAYQSDLCFTMLGYEPDELPKTLSTRASLIHPEDINRAQRVIDDHLSGKTSEYINENRLRRKDGSWMWCRSVGEIVERDENENPTRMVGVHLDIDYLKRFNTALEQVIEMESKPSLKETCEALCQQLVDLFSIDFAAVVQVQNGEGSEYAEVLGGVNKNEELHLMCYKLEGTPCKQGIAKPYTQFAENVCDAFPDDEILVDMNAQSYASVRLQDNNGKTIGLLVLVDSQPMPVRIKPEPTLRIFGARIASEIQRQKVEKGLQLVVRETEMANRAKSEFLANMSHEIRTPLTAIMGYTDLLLDPASNALDFTDHVSTVKKNAVHLMTVINDILDVSKIESGRLQIEQIETDPREILEDVTSLMFPNAEHKGLNVKLSIDDHVPNWIVTDPTRLRQIVLNLISNSIKFTTTGSVELVAEYIEAEDQLRVRCIDTGIGMTPEQRDRIAAFEPFSQADGSTARKYGGTGLGLKVSSMLADLLGGRIEIESEKGSGSTFSLTISACTYLVEDMEASGYVPQLPAKPKPNTGKPLDGCHILLAEDGVDNQKLISILVKRAGATVEIVANGQLAIDAYSESPDKYNLILMDIQMPEVDGHEATKQLRQMGCSIPIIALTAHAMPSDRAKCLSVGCDEYLAKPINREALISACEIHFEQGTGDTQAA